MGWLQRLSDGLTKTRDVVRGSMDRLLGRAADPALLEEFEAALIASDLGTSVVDRVLERLKKQLQGTDASQPGQVHRVLRDTLLDVLTPVQGLSLESLLAKGPKPFVILAVGVNGVGKTTTIAKIAQRLVQAGKAPLLVAADTFPRGGDRSAASLGRPSRRRRDPSSPWSRSSRRCVRWDCRSESATGGRGLDRYSRPAAHEIESHGRTPQNYPRHWAGIAWRTARGAPRAGRHGWAKRAVPSPSIPSSGRCYRFGPDEARRHCSRRDRRRDCRGTQVAREAHRSRGVS